MNASEVARETEVLRRWAARSAEEKLEQAALREALSAGLALAAEGLGIPVRPRLMTIHDWGQPGWIPKGLYCAIRRGDQYVRFNSGLEEPGNPQWPVIRLAMRDAWEHLTGEVR